MPDKKEDGYDPKYDINSDDPWERQLAAYEREDHLDAMRTDSIINYISEAAESAGDTIGDALESAADAIVDAWHYLFGDDEEDNGTKKTSDASE